LAAAARYSALSQGCGGAGARDLELDASGFQKRPPGTSAPRWRSRRRLHCGMRWRRQQLRGGDKSDGRRDHAGHGAERRDYEARN